MNVSHFGINNVIPGILNSNSKYFSQLPATIFKIYINRI